MHTRILSRVPPRWPPSRAQGRTPESAEPAALCSRKQTSLKPTFPKCIWHQALPVPPMKNALKHQDPGKNQFGSHVQSCCLNQPAHAFPSKRWPPSPCPAPAHPGLTKGVTARSNSRGQLVCPARAGSMAHRGSRCEADRQWPLPPAVFAEL